MKKIRWEGKQLLYQDERGISQVSFAVQPTIDAMDDPIIEIELGTPLHVKIADRYAILSLEDAGIDGFKWAVQSQNNPLHEKSLPYEE